MGTRSGGVRPVRELERHEGAAAGDGPVQRRPGPEAMHRRRLIGSDLTGRIGGDLWETLFAGRICNEYSQDVGSDWLTTAFVVRIYFRRTPTKRAAKPREPLFGSRVGRRLRDRVRVWFRVWDRVGVGSVRLLGGKSVPNVLQNIRCRPVEQK